MACCSAFCLPCVQLRVAIEMQLRASADHIMSASQVVMNLRFAPHLRAIAQRITGKQQSMSAGPLSISGAHVAAVMNFQ